MVLLETLAGFSAWCPVQENQAESKPMTENKQQQTKMKFKELPLAYTYDHPWCVCRLFAETQSDVLPHRHCRYRNTLQHQSYGRKTLEHKPRIRNTLQYKAHIRNTPNTNLTLEIRCNTNHTLEIRRNTNHTLALRHKSYRRNRLYTEQKWTAIQAEQ